MRTRIGFLLAIFTVLMPLGCSQQSTAPGVSVTQAPLSYVGPGEFGFSENGTLISSQNVSNNAQVLAGVSAGKLNGEWSLGLNCTLSGTTYNLSIVFSGSGVGNYDISANQIPWSLFISGQVPAGSFRINDLFGTLKITKFDTVNNLISGLFQFVTEYNGNPSTILNVDSGYFNNVPITSGSFGQGTISAAINGQQFGTSPASVQASNTASTHMLYISGDDSLGILGISIQTPVTLDSTYSLGPNSLASADFYIFSAHSYISWYSQDGTGSLTVTQYDMVSRRISANFSFTALPDSTSNVIHVTNGVINNVQWYDQ